VLTLAAANLQNQASLDQKVVIQAPAMIPKPLNLAVVQIRSLAVRKNRNKEKL
jgi:hypothetical protein